MSGEGSTTTDTYTERLRRLEAARWKRILNVQVPYRWNLRRLRLGRVLDVGCGIGRNLLHLPPTSVGVDHNPRSVELARARGLAAYHSDEFLAGPGERHGLFDTMLLAHVVEHMTPPEAQELVRTYLRFVSPGGRVLFICPQPRGFASDRTHITYFDLRALAELVDASGLSVDRGYSFPLPPIAGRAFAYNEWCLLARR